MCTHGHVCTCASVHVDMSMAHTELRGQPCRVGTLLLLCGFWRSNSVLQSWRQEFSLASHFGSPGMIVFIFLPTAYIIFRWRFTAVDRCTQRHRHILAIIYTHTCTHTGTQTQVLFFLHLFNICLGLPQRIMG